MTERSRLHARVLGHPTIAVVVPSFFGLTLHALLRGSLGFPAVFRDALALFFPLACVVEAVAGNAAHRRRSPGHARAREVLLLLLGVLAILVLLRQPLRGYGYIAVMILACWGLSFAIHESLRAREDLAHATQGLEGRELDRALHRALRLEGEVLTRLTRVRALVTALTGVPTAAVALLALAGKPVTPITALLLLALVVSRRLVTAALTSMATDQRLLGQGLRLDRAMRARRLTHGALLLGGATLISLAVARAVPLVPVAAVVAMVQRATQTLKAPRLTLGPGLRAFLQRLWGWLAGLFPPPAAGGVPMSPTAMPPVAEPTELAKRIGFALTMTLAAVALGLLVAFLTSPLQDPDVREGLDRGRPLRHLVRRLRLLGGAIRDLVARVTDVLADLVAQTRSAATAAARPAGGAAARPAEENRSGRARERRLRTARARARRAWEMVTRWAAELGVGTAPAVAPLELARRAGLVAPEARTDLGAAAFLLERVLYAGTPVEPGVVGELERLVRSITRGKGRGDGNRAGGRT